MADPARPVADAPIDTDWGQQVHDRIFTPRGTRVAGGSSQSVGTGFAQLQLNTAVDDPGGWLASDALTVPTGGAGLYLVNLDVQTDNGDADERTRVQLRVNGSSVKSFFLDQDGANAIQDDRSALLDLTAGDILTVYAAKSGGVNPDVLVRSLSALIQGTVIGA